MCKPEREWVKISFIMDYSGTIEYLYGLQKHGIKLGLENIRKLMAFHGGPQNAFRSVHIAGTNGKGSTAAALADILRGAGFKVGLFTSPHLVSFTERITVNGEEISEEDVVRLTGLIRPHSEELNVTFFEVVTLMGFLYFKDKGVDWAVVETGMGGRLDATNVLKPEVSVITSLGPDHLEFLGESMEDIAREKAGIIKPGVPVVTASHGPEEAGVVRATALENGSPLFVFGRDFSADIKDHAPFHLLFDYTSGEFTVARIELNLSGKYQAINASVAIKAFELITPAVKNAERAEIIRRSLADKTRPGRLELLPGEPHIVLDGAHNPAAAEALASTLKNDFLGTGLKMTLVMGVMSDKDAPGVLKPLLPLASRIIFTAPDYGRAARPEAMARIARSMGFESETAPTVKEAIEQARAYGEMVLVTGSFYTIGEAKEAMGAKGFLTHLREWQP